MNMMDGWKATSDGTTLTDSRERSGRGDSEVHTTVLFEF